MNEIVIKSGVARVVRKVLGVIAIVAGTAWLLANIGELKPFDIIYFVVFVLMGLAHLTNSFGQETTRLSHSAGNITIKWFNRFRELTLHNSEIEKIILKRFEVEIVTKEGKNRSLSLDNFETMQKKDIYQFFIDYSAATSVEIERQFEK